MSGDSGDIYQYNATHGARAKIRAMLFDIRNDGYSKKLPFSIGRVEKRMAEFANNNGIVLASKSVYFSSERISHSLRDSKKAKGLALSDKDFLDFPIRRKTMDLFYDGESFIYTDYAAKFIIHPNYKLKIKRKKTAIVNLVTAGKVLDKNEFKMGKYKKI